MSKYLCICGSEYKTKEMSDLHLQMNDNHYIFIKTKMNRFWEWFFSLPGKKISHFVGAYLVYFVLINHFHIYWNWWEATLIGLGMGLYIE